MTSCVPFFTGPNFPEAPTWLATPSLVASMVPLPNAKDMMGGSVIIGTDQE